MKSLLRSILLFLPAMLSLSLWAQEDEFRVPDSLTAKLKEFRKADAARAEALDACLQFFYDNKQIGEAATYINELGQLSRELNDSFWIAQSKYYQGLYALEQYEVSEALKTLNEALKIAETLRENERSELMLARIHLAQSIGLGQLNLSYESFEQIEKGLDIANNYDFKSIRNRLINNKAAVYFSLGKFEEALPLQKTLLGKEGDLRWLINLANLYVELNIYDTALYLYDSAALIAKYNYEKADILSGRCHLFNKLEEWDESERCLKEMHSLMPFDKSLHSVYLLQQAEVYFGKKQYHDALITIDSALVMAEDTKSISLECILLQRKANILSKIGDYCAAFENQSRYMGKLDTITNRNNEEKITALKYQQEYNLMKQQYESEQALLRLRQKSIIVVAIILVLFAAAFAFVLWKNKKAKEASLKSELDYRNREITSKALNQNQLNETLDDVIQDLTHLMNNPRENENTLPSAIHKLKGLLDDGSKKEFDYYFVEVHPDFYTKLKVDFPKLTQNELRLCALIKANLNIKDIANLNNVSIDSVKSSRKRLRKSLGISDPKIDLAEFLSKY